MKAHKKTVRLNIVILFGGESPEHEVSVQSAKNIVQALDTRKYNVKLIGISKDGMWMPFSARQLVSMKRVASKENKSKKEARANHGAFLKNGDRIDADVVFPVLHGTRGEDGSIQGLLKLLHVPFVGADVLGSAIGMDKDVTKRLLRDAGISVARFLVFKDDEKGRIKFQRIKAELGMPFFVKPASLGSSIGISRVGSELELKEAARKAFSYDRKILIEECIDGREIECSVLGSDHPIASLPGEIIPRDGFYSYEAKYIDEHGAILDVPAKLPRRIVQSIQEVAISTYKILNCEGMARVDFFLKKNGDVYVNEINTIPGFTTFSMYPKLWEASGISYAKLLDRLIELAIDRFRKEQRLTMSRG